ncbi:hypothetical protein Ahy_A02g008487 isoform A [Arachis hypogaea]|uniref:Tryptophan synthase beta chain-like PALP domain-containing protein n=1 Tax=Arachis hypogaea TaxID=3818 RepID=A0A445EEN8_ARAHY|nr:hypothetical protein Ahy_A02g008487 isoform A [Arachis hypogaea]
MLCIPSCSRFISCSQHNHSLRFGLHLHKHPLTLSFIHCGSHHHQMSTSSFDFDFLAKKPYTPPSWASHLNPLPSHVFSLAHRPTPIHRWNLPNLPPNTELWLKRDDLSGMQLSGNKVRKLEFLMADAVSQGADCIITIGGIQSNHCRATAVAAKYLNLDCYLILRTSKLRLHSISSNYRKLQGNVADGRCCYDAVVECCNSIIVALVAVQTALVDQDPGLVGNLLVERLVGAHVELISKEEYGRIGSVTLTNVLKEKLIKEGRKPYIIPVGGSNSLGTWSQIQAVDPAKGLGYALNTSEELNFVREIAAATGVVLDPVYSGKAAYGLLKDMSENSKKWEGRKILFIHTGGLLGLYDKVDQMASLVGNWRRMDVAESVPRQDGIGKMF